MASVGDGTETKRYKTLKDLVDHENLHHDCSDSLQARIEIVIEKDNVRYDYYTYYVTVAERQSNRDVYQCCSKTFLGDPSFHFMGGVKERRCFRYTPTEALIKVLVACMLTIEHADREGSAAIKFADGTFAEIELFLKLPDDLINNYLLGKEQLPACDFPHIYSYMRQSDKDGAHLQRVAPNGCVITTPGPNFLAMTCLGREYFPVTMYPQMTSKNYKQPDAKDWTEVDARESLEAALEHILLADGGNVWGQTPYSLAKHIHLTVPFKYWDIPHRGPDSQIPPKTTCKTNLTAKLYLYIGPGCVPFNSIEERTAAFRREFLHNRDVCLPGASENPDSARPYSPPEKTGQLLLFHATTNAARDEVLRQPLGLSRLPGCSADMFRALYLSTGGRVSRKFDFDNDSRPPPFLSICPAAGLLSGLTIVMKTRMERSFRLLTSDDPPPQKFIGGNTPIVLEDGSSTRYSVLIFATDLKNLNSVCFKRHNRSMAAGKLHALQRNLSSANGPLLFFDLFGSTMHHPHLAGHVALSLVNGALPTLPDAQSVLNSRLLQKPVALVELEHILSDTFRDRAVDVARRLLSNHLVPFFKRFPNAWYAKSGLYKRLLSAGILLWERFLHNELGSSHQQAKTMWLAALNQPTATPIDDDWTDSDLED